MWIYSKQAFENARILHHFSLFKSQNIHDFMGLEVMICQYVFHRKMMAYHIYDVTPIPYVKLEYPGQHFQVRIKEHKTLVKFSRSYICI